MQACHKLAQARRRLEQNGCLAVMAGRGALIKPWLFQEYAEGRAFEPDARERVGIFRRLVAHMKEYFGDDARGRGKAFYFLPWHFDFLTRYRSALFLASDADLSFSPLSTDI